MGDYNLAALSERDFEHVVQSFAQKVIAAGVTVFGDGPDGAREATYEGRMAYPSAADPWDGYLVVQSKHCARPTGDTKKDGGWAIKQLGMELAKFKDRKRDLKKPEYYIFVTNVILTPKSKTGSLDRAMALLKSEGAKLGLKDASIWHYDHICRLLDGDDDIRTAYANLWRPGDFLERSRAGMAAISKFADVDFERMALRIDAIHDSMAKESGAEATDQSEAEKAEIDRIGKYLEKGELSVASDLLDDVESKFGSKLSGRGHYRVLANRGNIERMRGNISAAAKYYLQAKPHQKDDKDARFLEAFAYHLMGENERARGLIEQLVIDHPEMARARSLQIGLAPPSASYDELVKTLSPEHRDDSEILLTLAHKAAMEDRYDVVEKNARRAHENSPEWFEASAFLADAIIQNEFRGPKSGELPVTEPSRIDRFREVVELSDHVITRCPAAPSQLARTRLNRGIALEALGRPDEASAEFLQAFKDSPTDPQVVFHYAAAVAGKGGRDEGISSLKKVVESGTAPPHVLLLYAQLLADRNTEQDRAAAIGLLKSQNIQSEAYPSAVRTSWVQTLVRLFLDRNEPAEARAILEELPTNAMPLELKFGLQARVEQANANKVKACEFAKQAIEAINPDSHPDDLRRLAMTLQQIELHELALDVWKRISPVGQLSFATEQLLNCAIRCHDDDLIIEICSAIRKAGRSKATLIEFEVSALGRRSPQQAAKLIGEILSTSIDEKLNRLLRLHRSDLSVDMKDDTLLEADPAKLPHVDEVDARIGRAVVQMISKSEPRAAIEYAYRLYRRYPDDFDAHMAVINSFMLPVSRRRAPAFPKESVVGEGCAVQFRRDGTRQQEWWIIESEPNPSMTRGEHAVSEPIVQRMLGKKKGDKFVLRESPVRAEAKIVQILPKFIYRFHDCSFAMETRFADKATVWSINVRRGKKYDFAEFFKELDQQAKSAEERDEWYKENRVPVSMFAELKGKSVLEAMQYITAIADLPIRCCVGSNEEMEAAALGLSTCTRVVLDPTALSTLFLTNSYSALKDAPFECAVTEHTLYDLKQVDLLSHPDGEKHQSLGKYRGQNFLTESTPEEVQAYKDQLKTFIKWIEEECTIVPGGSLSPLAREQRKPLTDAVGRATVESIIEGSKIGSVLWTDDGVIQVLATHSLKTRRVWTQAVFIWLRQNELIDARLDDRVAIDLMAAGYSWTRLGPQAILETGAGCGWDVENLRFGAALKHLGSPIGDLRALFQLVGAVIKALWQRGLSSDVVNTVTLRILKLLDERSGGRQVIEQLYHQRRRIFAEDLFNANRFGNIVEIWLSANQNKIIIPSLDTGILALPRLQAPH